MVDYQGVDVVPTHLGRPPRKKGSLSSKVVLVLLVLMVPEWLFM